MSAAFRTVRVAAITAGGPTQDFTISGLGEASTIKAAKVVVTRATVGNTVADHAAFSVGITDGTRHRVLSVVEEDNQNPSDSSRRGATDEVIQIMALDGTIDGEASFDSFITDGIRLSWGSLPAAAYLVTVTFYVGENMNARVDDFTSNATENLTTVVTSLGGRPMAIETFCNFEALDDTARDDVELSMGFVADGSGGIEQASWFVFTPSGTIPTAGGARLESDRAACRGDNVGGTTGGVEITALSATGFTATTRDAAGGHVVAFLALWSDVGHEASAGIFAAPFATGSDAFTGLGFAPGLLQFVYTQTTLEGLVNNNRGGVTGLGVGASASEEFGNAITLRDNVNPSNTTSFSDDKIIRARSATGVAQGTQAELTTLDSDGWTLNFLNVFGSPSRLLPFLAIENVFEVGGGGSGPIANGSGVLEQVHELEGGGSGPVAVGAGTLEYLFEFGGGGTAFLPTGAGILEIEYELGGGGSAAVPVGSGALEYLFEFGGSGVAIVPTGDGILEIEYELGGGGLGTLGVGAGTLELVQPALLQPLDLTLDLPAVSISGQFELVGGGDGPLPVGAGALDIVFEISGGGDGPTPAGAGTLEQVHDLGGAGSAPVPVGDGALFLLEAALLEPLDLTLDLPAVSVSDQDVKPDPLDLTIDLPAIQVFTGLGLRRLEFDAMISVRLDFSAKIQ